MFFNLCAKQICCCDGKKHASRVFYCHESKQAALPLNGRAALIILRLLSEGIAGCLSALTCTFSGNIHMFCMTFIILVLVKKSVGSNFLLERKHLF